MIQLQLETIAVCNAACQFCPYPTMKRKRGVMSQELFEKIIRDAADIKLISQVSFQGLGEPLLDGKIVERIRLVNKLRKGWETTMFTNGSRLTVQKALDLEKAGLSVLYVSLNAIEPRQRSEIMKLNDFNHVASVLDEVIERCRDMRVVMRVVVKAIVGHDWLAGEATEEFTRRWGHRAFLHIEGNWAGQTWKMRRPRTDVCSRAVGQIMVLWDGRISLCCFDGEGEVIFGDLNTQTLKEAYSNPEWVKYRERHVSGQTAGLKLCDGCTRI